MSEYREQAIRDVVEHTGACMDQVSDDASGDPDLIHIEDIAIRYAVAQRERVLRLEANFEKLKWAAMHVIEMNKQQAIDQYGNILEAESWACVRTLRAALSEAL